MKNIFKMLFVAMVAFVAIACENGEVNNNPDALAKPEFTCSVTGNTIMVSWEAIEGAAYYEITISNKATEKTDKTVHRFEDLEYNTEYTIKLQAIAADASNSSEVASCKVKTEELLALQYREWYPMNGAAATAMSNNGRWVVGGNDRSGFVLDLSKEEMVEFTGAEFYEISWMEMDGTTPKGIWLDEVNGALTAGKPYIFKATADEIAIVGDGTTAATPVEGVAGLTGTFTLIQDIETSDPSNTLEGNYMISGNEFLLCPAGCWLKANRAYIDATIIANHTTKKAEIPGRRRICLGETSENEATGFENIVAPEGQAVKAIVNGQLIIIRDGVMYNVQGQKL